MRLNRTAQIGLGVIVLAVILLVITTVTRRSTETQQANAANNATPASGTPGQPGAPVESGAYKARMDIPERTILTRDMFVSSRLEEGESENVFVTDFRSQAGGYITAKPILKDRKLRQDDLLGHISYLGVSAAVHDGYRALTIPVPNKPTLHDIVSIGDFVDVIATFDQAESRVLADGVRVLAVDIYGRDYEKASVAKRGGYRGEDRPGAAAPAPGATPIPGQAPGEPAPTPTPAPGTPQAVRPEAALTVEVKPEQAAAIALAQAGNSPLDFLLQPRPTTLTPPQATLARVIKPQVAPYAIASKRQGGGGTTRSETKVVTAAAPPRYSGPPMPSFTGPGPMSVTTLATPKPRTYDIIIYPDSLAPRTNTVPLPE